jgi:UDP-sulfoquinovose synthase
MSKKILICGVDGYIGWAFANHLLKNSSYEVHGLDNGIRRHLVKTAGHSTSAVPIASFKQRQQYFNSLNGNLYQATLMGDHYPQIKNLLQAVKPDVILHLAEMPAAPYSMLGPAETFNTIRLNVEGTMALLWALKETNLSSHIIKLGTMGIHGTPQILIPEGYEIRHDSGKPTKHLFYKKPGSYYHSTKVADTYNIEMACRLWDFRCTDIQQGVIYGHIPVPRLIEETRFDFDSQFGTAVNRFCMQAVSGRPITPYGKGNQKRGFLPLEDVMQCLSVVMANPPELGEYRSINQFDRVYSVNELAKTVQSVYNGIRPKDAPEATIENVKNPRREDEDHEYPVVSKWLREHGYKPKEDLEGTVEQLLVKLDQYRWHWENKIAAIDPDHSWSQGKL